MEPSTNTAKVSLKKPSLLGVLLSPAVQFERIRENPRILVPMLLMTVLMSVMLGAFMYLIVNDALIAQIQEAMPAEEAIDQVIFKYIMGGIGLVMGLLFTPIAFLIGAAVLKICTMIAGSDAGFKQLLSLTIYTSMVMILYYLVNNTLFAVVGYREDMTSFTSLGSLFPEGSLLAGIGSAFDVFYLWSLYLMFIGLQIVAAVTKKKAAIITGILFVILLLVSAAGGFAQPV